MTQEQKTIMRNIIYAAESGGYIYTDSREKIAYDTFTEAGQNSVNETGITIGAGQWHANRAKGLLVFIRETDPETFAALDNAGIAADLAGDWTNYKVSRGSTKAQCIQAIISSEVGKKCQDKMIDLNIDDYIVQTAAMGITLLDAQMMCANFIHQSPAGAKAIVEATTKPYTLDKLYKACLARNGTGQLGSFKTRQMMVYTTLKERISPYMNGELEKPSREMAIERMIAIAEAEVGYLEKASNDNLYDKEHNAGINNYTKYWEELNPGLQKNPWCAIFVTWVFKKAFGEEITKSMFAVNYPWARVEYMASKAKGRIPQIGDVVLYWRKFKDGTARYAHTGIVIDVGNDNDTFYTIEGNTSDGLGNTVDGEGTGVFKKTRKISENPKGYEPILFFTPDYSLVTGLEGDIEKKSGWRQENGGWRFYLGDTGECVKNDWYKDSEYWYWFDGAGMMVHNTWYHYNGEWYWFSGSGRMLSSNWYQYEENWYYFNEDGTMARNQWVVWKNKLYWLTSDGTMFEGSMELQTDLDGALEQTSAGSSPVMRYIKEILCPVNYNTYNIQQKTTKLIKEEIIGL